MASPRLLAFKKSSGLSFRQLATRLNVNVSTAHGLCHGGRRPGLALALRIESLTADWTHGPIRAAEWAPEAAA